MKGLVLSICALGAWLAGSPMEARAAEQVILSQGEPVDGAAYGGTRDALLINGGFASRHYGTGSSLWIGTGPKEDAAIRRSLLAFDLGTLPDSARGKQVRRALLRLTCMQVSGEPFVWQVHTVASENAVWHQEESSDDRRPEGKAIENVCSWNYRINFYQKWTGGEGLGEPGVGYSAEPIFAQSSGSETVRAGSVVEIEIPPEVVQGWQSGVNGGLLLRMRDEAQTPDQYIRFASSEHVKTGERPVLELELE